MKMNHMASELQMARCVTHVHECDASPAFRHTVATTYCAHTPTRTHTHTYTHAHASAHTHTALRPYTG